MKHITRLCVELSHLRDLKFNYETTIEIETTCYYLLHCHKRYYSQTSTLW